MNMKKCKINSVYVAGLLRQLSLTCLMIFCLGFGLQAQDSGSGGDQSKVGEELDQFVNRFLDWVVVSYATYTGQHDAELESIFAKAKDALDKIEAGATLVQVYTGFIYEGPKLVKSINKALLKK